MKIQILSRQQAEQVLPFKGAALISITCPGDSMPKIVPGWEHVLHIEVDDIKEDLGKKYTLFNKDHAGKIITFVFGVRPTFLFINCDAGISRSAGVAVALREIMNNEYIGGQHRYALHNRHITSIILEHWFSLSPKFRRQMKEWLKER